MITLSRSLDYLLNKVIPSAGEGSRPEEGQKDTASFIQIKGGRLMVPSQQDMEAVVAQIEELRRDNKNLKDWVIALGLVIGLSLFSFWLSLRYGPQMITTEALFVQDAKGKTRAALGVFADHTLLSLRDAEGKEQIGLSANSVGPSIILSEGITGKMRARLSTRKDGSLLSLHDSSGKTRVLLKYAEEKPEPTLTAVRTEEVSLILYDKDGQTLFTAP